MRRLYSRQIQEIMDNEREQAKKESASKQFDITKSQLPDDIKPGDPTQVKNEHLNHDPRIYSPDNNNKSAQASEFELPESAKQKIRESQQPSTQ